MKRRFRKRKTTGILGNNVIDMFKRAAARKLNDNNEGVDEDGSEGECDEDATMKEEPKLTFQYKWLNTWSWMRYDKEDDAVFCTTCERFAISVNSPFTKGGSRNFKTSSFYEHAATKTHITAEAKLLDASKVHKPIVVSVQKMQSSVDGAVLNLFRAAYTVASRSWSFNDYAHLIDLIDLVGCAAITKQLYHDDHACQEFICCIGDSLHASLIAKVAASPFFGVQVDESTDVATQQHLVVCVSYLEHGSEPRHNFLSMLKVHKADAASLCAALLEHLRGAGIDMTKLVGFGSDGASTMTGSKTGVATRLKSLYPYMTAIHCIAHRENLAVQDAAKHPSMEWLEEIETLVNSIAAHFSRSSKRLDKLQDLLEEYACSILRLQGIQDTRWLSRHNAISRLCEDLPAVLKYVELESREIFTKVTNFKTIYLLHFLADILGGLTILSKMFQARHVDITVIEDHVKTSIEAIQAYYIIDPQTDLNACQEDAQGFPIIPDYGPPDGWLAALRSSIHGVEYRTFRISRSKDLAELEGVIEQQKAYSRAVCECLKNRFEDISILKHFNIFSPLNMPRLAIKARKFGEESLEKIIDFYGTAKSVRGLQQASTPLIDANMLRREYSDYKIHALANWPRKDIEGVCLLISSNSTNGARFKNILILLQIALVQCASNAICESLFSHRTNIKSRWRAKLNVGSLNACLSIVVNGPAEAREFDFTESIEVWKKKADNRGRHIYSGNPSEHLV